MASAEHEFPELGDTVDPATFSQILEMDDADDDADRFSKGIVFNFFDQAKDTFKEMETALQAEDLEKLSALGHFLKGSSATLGLVKVRDACEKIQRYGKQENIDGSPLPDRKLCLKLITETLEKVQGDYEDVKNRLTEFFGEKIN